MAELIEDLRRAVSRTLDPERRSELGQFMTPLPVARFMAGLFSHWDGDRISLLDAGAGIGSLTSAFVDGWLSRAATGGTASVAAYELDPAMRRHLARTLAVCRGEALAQGHLLQTDIMAGDFIELGSEAMLPLVGGPRFTHAILNPPYRKLGSGSEHRRLLRSVGIETVNLYTAFLAIAVALLAEGGELVAIVPRSFCNGPYYRPFRAWMHDHAALTHLHLFASRRKPFAEDEVLQENIIVKWVRGAPRSEVIVSWCEDGTFADLKRRTSRYADIVKPDDPAGFIHIPIGTDEHAQGAEPSAGGLAIGTWTLDQLGLTVSTGPVVDFRLRAHLHQHAEAGTAPLLYPQHFAGGRLSWPQEGRKPNAIAINGETERWLFPRGRYVVTKRFTAKEEPRRIVAHVVEPGELPDSPIGFENHLNVFHAKKKGLSPKLARGLALFLNSTRVDRHFRLFSGHTQVNATDLKTMHYPSRVALETIGEQVPELKEISQEFTDTIVNREMGW